MDSHCVTIHEAIETAQTQSSERSHMLRFSFSWWALWLLWLHPVTAVPTTLTEGNTLTYQNSRTLRINLTTSDQGELYTTLKVGTPSQSFRVLIDTGSSDIWVAGAACNTCSREPRYQSSRSSTSRFAGSAESSAFVIDYGSGDVSGHIVEETICLEDICLTDASVGIVDHQSGILQHIKMDGVIGLGMDVLAAITKPTFLQLLGRNRKLHRFTDAFSLFISPYSDYTQPSQLLFGGIDDSLAGMRPTWFHFDVVQDLHAISYGYWSLRVHQVAINAHQLLSHRTRNAAAATSIVDSGTSLILLPKSVFYRAMQLISDHLGPRFQYHTGDLHESLCRYCTHKDFPELRFDFIREISPNRVTHTQQFVLQGSDYVQCDQHREICTPQLDVSDSEEIVILGVVFLRAYYTKFDIANKQIGFACPFGNCNGGYNPGLWSMKRTPGKDQWAYGAYLVVQTIIYLAFGGVIMQLILQTNKWSFGRKSNLPSTQYTTVR